MGSFFFLCYNIVGGENMLESALKFIKEICDHGFTAYIVGGFVRDYILKVESNDIDVATNAKPKEIKEIFENSCLPSEDYGSVTVMKWGIRFEVTTFRKEISYVNNRKPAEIQYIDDLYQDLLRRDFTINTICMNFEGEIIDFLGGQDDLEAHVIRTVGLAKERFEEDCLRILRAVRFATILDFQLDDSVIAAIKEKKYLLKNLSYYRKKEELDKIFTSSKASLGIQLLLQLGLDKDLELERLGEITKTDSLIAVWSILDVVDKYPFSNNEKSLIKEINEARKLNNLDPMALYRYGLYANSVAGYIKGLDKKKIAESYQNLVIHSRKDLDITTEEILSFLKRKPGNYLKDIYCDLEHEVLYRRLPNQKQEIFAYLQKNYL